MHRMLPTLNRHRLRLPQALRHPCAQVADREVVEEVVRYEAIDFDNYCQAKDCTRDIGSLCTRAS